ncbi:MAG TPA: hypothetical protein VK425_09610, partial [Acidimicrobiales bacterium]|nr:hypothetical protein [Acidimicrobiales bacterium]
PSPYLERLTMPPALPKPVREPRTRKVREILGQDVSGHECPHCAGPLKGIAARRLGVCAECVTSVPGETGEKARALVRLVADAAKEARMEPHEMVTAMGILRLLDEHPHSGRGVGVTIGVRLNDQWAERAAEILRQ